MMVNLPIIVTFVWTAPHNFNNLSQIFFYEKAFYSVLLEPMPCWKVANFENLFSG